MQRVVVGLILVVLKGCAEGGPGGANLADGSVVEDASTLPDVDLPRDAAVVEPIPDAAPSLRDAGSPTDSAVQVPDSGAERDAAVVVVSDAAPGPGAYRDLFVDGNAVSVYLPHFQEGESQAPVVLSLHGLSIPAIAMADITGLPAIADRDRFIAVFPAGVSGTWNTGGAVCGLGSFAGNAADDVTYVEHILDAVNQLHRIDRSRVFVSGFSMGGYSTNALACRKPSLFRGAAPAAGGYPTGVCAPGPLPVMIFHGTGDGTISHQCGVEARAAWAVRNGCSTEVDSMPVMGGTCEWSRGCPANGQVVFCSFQGMGHGWAGSLNPFALGGLQFESATALMWSFFKTYL